MKQWDIDQMAARAERRVMLFGKWMWFLILPALSVVLFLVFSANQPPPRHLHPPVFSCASENAALAPLGAGGQIAPLCNNAQYPDAPAGDGG